MRENAGFQIIASVPIGDCEVVIGQRHVSAGAEYVCWFCLGEDNYFWGKYSDTYEGAVHAMIERLYARYPGVLA